MKTVPSYFRVQTTDALFKAVWAAIRQDTIAQIIQLFFVYLHAFTGTHVFINLFTK